MNVLSLFDGISCGYLALQRAGINIDDYNDYNTGLTEIFNGWLEGQYDDQSIMEYAYDCNDEQLGLFNLIPLIIYLKEKEII